MNYTRFLGYEKGADGKPIINEKEALTVRLIYRLFMEGKTPGGICRENEEIDALTAKLKVVSELVSECVSENARKKQSQDVYTKKYADTNGRKNA